jgi:hypothetical protein
VRPDGRQILGLTGALASLVIVHVLRQTAHSLILYRASMRVHFAVTTYRMTIV